MAATRQKKMITLKSSDGVEFEVEAAAAKMSLTISNVIHDGCADNGIPVPNVDSKILSKVIEYCNKHKYKHVHEDRDSMDIKNWDAEFVKVDTATLFDLVLAANYLDIPGLLDLTCQAVADMIKGKSPEKMCKIFNIKNEFTPEEEEELRREHPWAFE